MVIFARRQDARREEDGPGQGAAVVAIGERCSLRHRLAGAGGRPACGAAPVGLPPEGARQAAAPQSMGGPPALPLWLQWRSGFPVAYFTDGIALTAPIRPSGPDGWRAAGAPLMTVKKILTGQRILPCQSER
jgi:hypothetical protein